MRPDMNQNYISPYIASIYDSCILSPHKHYDVEIIYSKKGSIHYTLGNKKYDLHPNQMIIINSIVTHSSDSKPSDTKVLLLKIGYAFLRDLFPAFSAITYDNPVIDLSTTDKGWQKKIKDTLECIYNNLENSPPNSALMIQSDLYRFSYYIMEMYQQTSIPDNSPSSQHLAETKLENVFNYVFNNYHEDITVEDAAKVSGYAKEYFCKIFKEFTNESFHQFLNRVRVDQAQFLITNSSLSISEIANTVGVKSDSVFRSVFKKFTNFSPTEYRKKSSVMNVGLSTK